MITVLAIDQNDGWLFAKQGKKILLIRPPYRPNEGQLVSEAIASRGVTHHDYVEVNKDFADWLKVTEFARETVARQRELLGHSHPSGEVATVFLSSAPATTIERFLKRIREELLPRQELDAAERLLLAILAQSPHLDSVDLRRRTAKLLEDVRYQTQERLAQHTRDDDQFPRLAKSGRLERSRVYAEQIASSGSIFIQP